MRHALFWGFSWRGFAMLSVYKGVATQAARACPAFALLLPVAAVTYSLWTRTRYFGNTAPLLIAALFAIFAIGHPHTGGAGFLLASLPFLFIFVSGVLADLLETRYRPVILASILGLLIAYVAGTLLALAQVPRG